MKLCLHENLPSFLNGNKVYPINIEISLVGFCNAKCDWCFYKDNTDTEILDHIVLVEFLIKCKEKGVKAISWTGGGEPSLHPQFNDIVRFASGLGFSQGMFTNALGEINYDPSKFDWIRVSKTDRPFNENNLKKLKESCKSVGLNINYIQGDDKTLINALCIAEKLDLDYVQCRPALNLNGDVTTCEVPNIKHSKLLLTDYKFDDAKKFRDYNKCYGYHFVPFLWHNGDYSVCAYHKNDPYFTLGNIYKNSLDEIINNMSNFKATIKSCQICCKNHEINKLVNNLKDIEDINFV
jgi:MoaA/NifB/PqqE/SkfB family radical SAM enzyme